MLIRWRGENDKMDYLDKKFSQGETKSNFLPFFIYTKTIKVQDKEEEKITILPPFSPTLKQQKLSP